MPVERGEIARFLDRAGWGGAGREALAGDASSRRFERLRRDDGALAVLMVVPDGSGEMLARFADVGRHLRGLGLSAPENFAAEPGLMLLEDLGDGRYPELLARAPEREGALFAAATEVLVALHGGPAPAGPDLGPAVLTDQAGLAYETYGPAATGRADPAAQAEMQALMAEAFAALPAWSPVLVLRDFHAGNLFWLPEREGPARVGLIDFQDAGLGHPLYDLVSLARDARRDVAPETVVAMQSRYAEARGIAPGTAWPLLAVQRNLRILGIFARLGLRDGKPDYLDFLPRTWALMREDLEHVSLTRLKSRILADLPAPTSDLIARLKAQCPTAPMP